MSQSIQLQVTQVGLEQSIAAAMKRVGNSSQINLGTNSKQINALSQPLGRITGQADEFSKSMAAANARVLAFGASAGIIVGVSQAMSGLLASTIKVEKSLVEIGTVLNSSGEKLDKFGQDIFNVAKNTGKSFSEVASGALELARQGLSAEDTLARLNDAMILSRLSGLDAAQSVQGLTAAFNSFKSSGISTAEILNKVVAAAQSFAVSEKDIIEGLGRSASVADLAGVSFNELAAIITAIQEKTARGGAVIGNSLKTIFARIQDRAVISDLDDMGITVKNLQGDVLPALKILENLAAELGGFSQIEQADISKKLGGIYQLDKLLAALMDLSSESSVYRKTLEEIGISGDKAYKKNAVLNETLASIINKVAVSAEQLGAKLGEIGVTDSLKNVLGFFNSLLEGIQKVLGEESGLGTLVKGLVKGLGNFFAGPGLALFGAIILKLSKDLIQFGFASLKAFFGIGQAAKEVQNVESAISQVLARNVGLQQKLFALEGNRAGQLKLITGALVEQEALLRRSASISSGLAAPLYGVGVRATDSGLRIKNKAGGYMPAVAKENQAINSGVGGARRGDKPVVMPNFNFGQGKKGTVVAHTGEYVVPNFGGGKGSAIFNRDMVQKMGLPDGAKKITASGGLIPNFKDVEITKKVSEFSSLGRLVTAKKVDSIDSFTSSISPIEQTLTSSEYTKKAQNQLKEIVPKFGRNNLQINKAKLDKTLEFFKKAGVDNTSIQTFKSAVQNLDPKRPTSGQFLNIQNRMKGILGEIDASEMSGQKLNQGNSFLDLSDGSEVKTVKSLKASEILKKGINQYLLSSNIYDGEDNKTQLGKIPVYLPKGTPLLNSASGFIPNFAPKFNAETVRQYANDIERYKSPTKDFYEFPDGTGGYGANVRLVLSRSQSKAVSNKQEKEKKISDKGFYNLDADALGGILLVSPRFGKSKGSLNTSMPIGKIPFFNQEKSPSIDKNKYIKLNGIKTANTPSGRDLQTLQGDISQLFAGGIVDLAYKLYGSTFDPASGGEFASKLKSLDPSKKQQLLPAAAQGDLFEAAGKVALNSFANLESLFGSAEQSRPFDFQNASALQKMFGVNAKRGEAKRGGEKNFSSSDQVSGIVKKVFNDPEYSLTALESLKGQGAFNFSKAQKAATVANAFGGFVPNFAISGLDADLKNNVLAGRVFEALLRNEKSINMTENRVGPDITSGPLAIREAKLSGKSAYNDPNFGSGKPKGKNLILPSNAIKDYDDRLIKNKNADILRSGISTKRLFALAERIKTREEGRKTNRNNVPLYAADGFVPNFSYQFKKDKNLGIRSIQHPETKSELNYAKGGEGYLDMVGIHSERSGQGLELFKRLGKIARRSGRKVRSSSLVPQRDRLKLLREDSNIDQILKLIYPQLSYRQKSGVKNTKLDFEFGEIEKTISGSNIFDLVKNQFKNVKSAELISAIQNRGVGFSSVIDTFADGFVPNFALSPKYITETLARIKAGTSGFSKQEQETFLRKFGARSTGGKLSIRDVYNKLDGEMGVSQLIDKAYAQAGAAASSEDVYRVFENQTKANPYQLRSAVSKLGFVPNFAVDLTRSPEQIENKRIKNAKKQNWKTAQGAVGKIFGAIDKAGPTVLVDGVISGAEIQGLNLDYIKTLIENNGAIAQMFLGDKGSNFVIQAKKYGVTVQQSAMKKLTSFAAKSLNKVQGLAGGFLPNFASPLQDAVGREMAAGVPASQIYIDKSPALKNAANPMGLMVANRRDEPAGGFQGINRARKEGANPMMYGAAGGFVPNYAAADTGGASGGISKVLVGLFAFQTAVSVATGFLEEAGDSGKKVAETLQKVAATALIFGGIAFSGPVKRLKEFSDAILGVTKTAKQSKGGPISGFSQGFRSGLAGKGDEFYTPKGIDPALANRYNRRLSNRYNLSGVGLGAGRVGAVAGGATRGIAAVAGSVLGPATLAIGAFKIAGEAASGFRTYSNAAAKSLGEMSVYANKATQSLSELDKAAIESQSNKSYGYSFDSLVGSLQNIVGASAMASAVSGQKLTNTNFQGRNLELSNVSEDQFKQTRQNFIGSYVGANRTKFKTAEDAAGKAAQEFSSLVGESFNEYDAQVLTEQVKELSKEAQKMQKENAIAEALKEAALESEIAETDLKNLTAVLGDSAERIKLLKQTIFDLQSSTDVFKSVSEAAIDNAYNLSEYDKTIQKLGVSLESLDASSAVKQLDLVAKTQENIFNLTKENLKGQGETVQSLGLGRVFQDIQDKITSGEKIKIGGTDGFQPMDLQRLFGSGYTKTLEDLSKEFNSQTTELKNQAKEAQNNANIEAYRSLLAQQTTAALESQTKQFDLQKSSVEKVFDYIEKIRNSTDKISDLNFERGLIGATQTQKLSAQIGRTPELQRRAREASLSSFKQDRVGSVQSLESLIPSTLSSELQFSLKSGILEATKSVRAENTLEGVSKTATKEYNETIKKINDAVQKESKNRQGYIDQLQKALVGSSVTFENSVISAANKFKEITVSAATIPLENSKKDLEAQRIKIEVPTFTPDEKTKLDELKLRLNKFETKNRGTRSLERDLPENSVLLKKEEEIAKATEAVGELDAAIKLLETRIKEFLPAPISSDKIPEFLKRPVFDPKKLTEAPTIAELPTEDTSEAAKALESTKLDLASSLLEISNSSANAADELEKLQSVSRMLGDEFKQLQEGIPAAIAAIISERNKSISGAEILGANYDLETQRQYAGAETQEERDKITRDRKNKGLGQLFAEEYGKTPEEQALDLKKTIVDGSVQFKNNMIEAMMGAIEGTGSLKDGLRSAAYEFVKTINQKMMSNLVDKIVGGSVQSGGGGGGGLIQGIASMFGMASGGIVNGGSGSKDDVPAMLMGGEYVVNKKAVSKYGAQFLESVNNGTLTGYAQGGSVQRGPQGNFYTPGTFGQGAIEGKRNLLDFATQTGTTGQFDKMINQSGYQAIDLEPESSRLSVSGMRNSPQFEATQAAKEQAFDLYLQQYNAEIEAKKAEKEQKKAFRKQLLMLAISAVAAPVLGAAGAGFGAAFKAAGASGQGFMSQLGAGFKGIFTGGKIGSQQVGGLGNLFSSAGKAFSGDFAGASNQFKLSQIGNAKQLSDLYQSDKNFASYIDKSGGIGALGAGRVSGIGGARSGMGVVQSGNVNRYAFSEPDLPIPGPDGFDFDSGSLLPLRQATGGMIPSTSGIDTVPAMLSGGEFVMNRSAVQGIGASNLQSMNSGGTSITSEETSKKLNEQLLAKLDELISASGSTGDITINVAPSGQSSQETSQNPSESRQQLARQIKDAVLQIINDEKRIGGSLRR